MIVDKDGTDSVTGTYIISDGLDATDMATVTITVSEPAGVEDASAQVPLKFELLAPRPNPSRGNVEFTFGLPEPGQVRVEVFDAAGRRVTRLANGEVFSPGYRTLRWDGRNEIGAPVATGILSGASETHRSR